jgi:hypothetical protein
VAGKVSLAAFATEWPENMGIGHPLASRPADAESVAVIAAHTAPACLCCRQTEGFSCSELLRLCQQAARQPAQEVSKTIAAGEWACHALRPSDSIIRSDMRACTWLQ